MSHVDEGTLHAWLDGALDALPAAEAERVRAHLAVCPACAARLEEERAIRQEAADILGAAVPAPGDAPAFEELRALARARSKSAGAAGRISRMAWAASVVLALGAGWMLRDAVVPDFGRRGLERGAARLEEEAATGADATRGAPGAQPAATLDATGGASAATVDAVGREAAESSREVRPATPAAPLPGEPVRRKAEADRDVPTSTQAGRVAPVPGASADAPAARQRSDAPVALEAFTPIVRPPAQERSLPVPPPSERVLPEPAWLRDAAIELKTLPRARFDTLAFPRTVAEAKEAVAAASMGRPAGAKVTAAPVTAAGRELGGVASNAVAAAGIRSDPAADEGRASPSVLRDGASATSGSLVVPGLEVLSVAGLDPEGLPGAVRVRQRLADGDTLELVHLPAGLAPSALAPVARDGRTELVLPRDGGWLVVRAHADREALLELVRRMDEGR